MDKINLPFFYKLGAQLNPFVKMKIEPKNRINLVLAALPVRDSINGLLAWSGGLSVCRPSATAFLTATEEVLKWWRTTKPEDTVKPDYAVDSKLRVLIDKAKTFETVLCEELVMSSAYSASKKGIYSTSDLIEQADKVFPISILGKLSEDIVWEIKEAGKCLAFDIPTASGFHMIRATERVMHEYYVAVGNPEKNDKLENWGAYIAYLYKLTEQKGKVDRATVDHIKRVLALLQQVKDQDRNMIIHPEVVLNADEAFLLFETTKTVIMTMADKMSGG